MWRSRLLAVAVGLCVVAFCTTTQAYKRSKEYYKCLEATNYTSDRGYVCIKEENAKIFSSIKKLQEQLKKQNVFAGLVATGKTPEKQLENYKKYVSSYCEYWGESECDAATEKKLSREECIYNFMATLEEDWRNLLKETQKAQGRRF